MSAIQRKTDKVPLQGARKANEAAPPPALRIRIAALPATSFILDSEALVLVLRDGGSACGSGGIGLFAGRYFIPRV